MKKLIFIAVVAMACLYSGYCRAQTVVKVKVVTPVYWRPAPPVVIVAPRPAVVYRPVIYRPRPVVVVAPAPVVVIKPRPVVVYRY